MSEDCCNFDLDYEDEICNDYEEKKIIEIKSKRDLFKLKENVIYNLKDIHNQNSNYLNSSLVTSLPPMSFWDILGLNKKNYNQQSNISISRKLGLNKYVNVNNISGKNAWIIISPAPVKSISSLGIEKLGNISFQNDGEYKCQESSVLNNSSEEFDLDNSKIYYTTFFNCDNKWKLSYKNRKINTKKMDINLLEKHVLNSIDYDFLPVK